MNLSAKAQAAAVAAYVDEGRSLDWVRKNHPQLAEGVRLVAESEKKKERGQGPMAFTPPSHNLPSISLD